MLRFISDSDPAVVQKILEALPTGSRIVSLYGLNGRHVAWVEMPEPVSKPKIDKKGK